MSDIHRFFYPDHLAENSIVTLDADTTKHIWQVLRMKEGDMILLTDGKGTVAEAMIQMAEKHKCNVFIKKTTFKPRHGKLMHLCVSFTKNNSRNEWLLEKATELGVGAIIPVATARCEKIHIRHDRWGKILQSAILQSQQSYLPELSEITTLADVLAQYSHIPQKLVAHCIKDSDKRSLHEMLKPSEDAILLIGPEGDFTQDEVNLCIANGFLPVSLGTQRLRTETAGLMAAAYFNAITDV